MKDVKSTTKNRNNFKLGEFSPKAKDFIYNSDAFINIAHGSVRSGKTIAATLRFLTFLGGSPYQEFMISGKTRDTIERNVIRDLIKLIDGRIPYKYRKFDNYIEIEDKKVWLIGFSDEGATEKVRGMTVGGWYTDYINNKELTREGIVKVWHFNLNDNYHLSDKYKEELKRVNRKSKVSYKRNILGEWVIAEGAIYDTFDEDIHVQRAHPQDMDEINICCDYGVSTVTTFGVMGVQKHHKGNTYYLLDETYYDAEEKGVAQSDTERVQDIIRLQNKYKLNRKSTLFLPHDAASLKAQCKKDKRLKMKIRTYAPNTYRDINTIQDLFNTNHFFIDPKCKNSITQAQTYSWDIKAQQRGEDKPLKINDHCPDMWRGGILGPRHNRRKVIA